LVVDHNERMMISSTPGGALRMAEDTHGLHVESPWPRTDYADNVRGLYDSGEKLGMSLNYSWPRNGVAWTPDNASRSVTEAILKHVSVLATMEPAFDGTVGTFRALADLTEADVEDVNTLMEALRDGRRLDEGEFNLLTKLTEAVKPEPVESATEVVAEPDVDADRAVTEKWLARLTEIEASIPKS
jgi:hypothetical protein